MANEPDKDEEVTETDDSTEDGVETQGFTGHAVPDGFTGHGTPTKDK